MENEKTTRKQLFEIYLNLILPGIPSTSSPAISLPFSKGKALGTSIPIYPELTPLQYSRKYKLVCLSAAVRLRIRWWWGEGGGRRKKSASEARRQVSRGSLRSPIFFLFGPVFCLFSPLWSLVLGKNRASLRTQTYFLSSLLS